MKTYVTQSNPVQRSWTEYAWDAWCIASVIGIWPRYIEPNLLLTSRYRVPIPTLPHSLSGLRVVHFADVHVNQRTSARFLTRVRRTILSLKPDLILFSGDLLSYSQLSRPDLADLLFSKLSAPLGVYACLGNHDYEQYATTDEFGAPVTSDSVPNPIVQGFTRLFQLGKEQHQHHIITPLSPNKDLLSFYSSHNVTLLHNETVAIGSPPYHINLTGLGDLTAGDFDPNRAFRHIPAKVPTIVLAHNPDVYAHLSYLPGDLFLFGHTHGGQVNIPFIWQRLTSILDKSLKSGRIFRDNRTLFISRGVGATFPFRWFAPPEVTLFELVAEGPLPVESSVQPFFDQDQIPLPFATQRGPE